jgi:hypothetical protein
MTKNLLRSVLIVLSLVLGICGAAQALVFGHKVSTPEIDPGLAVSAFTLLAGSLVVLRPRRKK